MDNVEETNGLPNGLCAKRGDHEPHSVLSDTLGEFWCTGREFDRQPGKAERLRRLHDTTGTPAPQHDVRNF